MGDSPLTSADELLDRVRGHLGWLRSRPVASTTGSADYLERLVAALREVRTQFRYRSEVSEVPAMVARVDAAFSNTRSGDGTVHVAEVDSLYAIYRWAERLHDAVYGGVVRPGTDTEAL